jgi:cation diffusion facilitator CzcD-associated flavoprotein CzcO
MAAETSNTLMTIYGFRVSTYANAVYVFGSNRLTARDGFTGVPASYYGPVEIFAATGKVNGVQYIPNFTGYTDNQLSIALASGWINQQEYDETMAYKYTIT